MCSCNSQQSSQYIQILNKENITLNVVFLKKNMIFIFILEQSDRQIIQVAQNFEYLTGTRHEALCTQGILSKPEMPTTVMFVIDFLSLVFFSLDVELMCPAVRRSSEQFECHMNNTLNASCRFTSKQFN